MTESAYRPYERECDDCEFLYGDSVPYRSRKDDCEVRKDISVKKGHCVRLWGRVKTYENEPIEGALVKLCKMVYYDKYSQLVGIAHTVTDCKGFYQFDICDEKECADYRIIVGKAAYGRERVLESNGCCHPCACKKD